MNEITAFFFAATPTASVAIAVCSAATDAAAGPALPDPRGCGKVGLGRFGFQYTEPPPNHRARGSVIGLSFGTFKVAQVLGHYSLAWMERAHTLMVQW